MAKYFVSEDESSMWLRRYQNGDSVTKILAETGRSFMTVRDTVYRGVAALQDSSMPWTPEEDALLLSYYGRESHRDRLLEWLPARTQQAQAKRYYRICPQNEPEMRARMLPKTPRRIPDHLRPAFWHFVVDVLEESNKDWNRASHYHPWSEEEKKQLKTMLAAGASITEIAQNIERTEAAIRTQAHKQGLMKREAS